MYEWFWQTDATAVLDSVHMPTLMLWRAGNEYVDEWRHLASRIASARTVELPGDDLFVLSGDSDAVVREIQRFVEGLPGPEADEPEVDRVLATVLYPDIVGSTERAAAMGDRAWSELLEEHHARSVQLVARHRGRVVDTSGDGMLATFDGPGPFAALGSWRMMRSSVAWRSGQGCTRGNASWWATGCVGLPCTWERGSWLSPGRQRCWSPAP